MPAEALRFELDRLTSYDDQSLLDEIRRVAQAHSDGLPLTRRSFDAVALVSSSAVVRRFGGWQKALAAADLDHLYGGRTVSDRMRSQAGRGLSAEEMISALQSAAETLGTNELSRTEFDRVCDEVKASAVSRRFGSWTKAVAAAGLLAVPHGRRWTDNDYFENLLAVWTAHGRRPVHREMDEVPSRISSGAYESRFGTWTKALSTFVERMQTDTSNEPVEPVAESSHEVLRANAVPVANSPLVHPGGVRVGLRYQVLNRDRFRCVLCGASPATSLKVQLHVDHILPRSRGGTTDEANLQTLCQGCNLGKAQRTD